jgi:hypothetical protein
MCTFHQALPNIIVVSTRNAPNSLFPLCFQLKLCTIFSSLLCVLYSLEFSLTNISLGDNEVNIYLCEHLRYKALE